LRVEVRSALFAVSKRSLALALGAAAALAACAGLAAAALNQGPGIPIVRGVTKVTLCHATSSETNPYVELKVDDDSVVKEGHGDHPDDIIPPFKYVEDGVTKEFPGLNWDARHQAIFLNGCDVPEPPKPEPPPQPVQVFVNCVDNNGKSFTAVFGYTNPNNSEVTPSANAFAPAPKDRGQPPTFAPGTVGSAVSVTANAGDVIVWTVTVGGKTTSASTETTSSCQTEPPPQTPPSVKPFVNCVDNTGDTFSATFTYTSAESATVTIPAGSAGNSFSPAPANRGQPSTFAPGSDEFTVMGIPNGTSLAWTLTTETATATANFETKCTPTTTPPAEEPIALTVTCVRDSGARFAATFGYVNPNANPIEIPAGPGNDVTVRVSRSAGQPTTFAIGNVPNAFTVTDIPAGADVTWTVKFAGVTSVASINEASPHCGVDPENPPIAYRIGVFVSCVTNQGSTYSAIFGYSSEDTQAKRVPIGDRNRFFPAPESRGQPELFEPGNHESAFTVTGIPTNAAVAWSLTSDQTRSAEASAGFEPKCDVEPPEQPEPPPAELVPIGLFVTCVTNHSNTYDAVFGYSNDNRAEQIIPLGLSNTFTSAPGNRGQPTTFEPGTVRNAVTVRGIPNGSSLAWSIMFEKLRVAVANESLLSKCDETPLPPPPPPPKPPESGLFATCVLRLGAPTYTAIFGYANASGNDVIIPIGRQNLVAPAPINRGQPNVFRPGVVLVAFTVDNVPRTRRLTWRVSLSNGEVRTATVSARFPRNCVTAPPAPSADLVLQKSVADAQVSAGQRVTYKIHVVNRGPNIAVGVRIVDVLDPRLELLSASSTRGSCTTSGQRVSCRVLELPPGAGVTVIVAARARGSGTINNVAVATHNRRDPTRGNNVGSAVIHVVGVSGAITPAFTG
jgi:uncharacterized repeat protein (TIGR01451 family)